MIDDIHDSAASAWSASYRMIAKTDDRRHGVQVFVGQPSSTPRTRWASPRNFLT